MHLFMLPIYAIIQDSALYNLACLNNFVYCQNVITVLGFLN